MIVKKVYVSADCDVNVIHIELVYGCKKTYILQIYTFDMTYSLSSSGPILNADMNRNDMYNLLKLY